MIVCLEGIDACGKGTQSKLLANRMHAHLYHFPEYTSRTGRLIQRHLKGEWTAVDGSGADSSELNALVFQSLMLTNRMELASQLMQHRLAGRDIVLDRYWPSGIVYGSADGLSFEYLLEIHKTLPQAHHYVLIDIPAEASKNRRPERSDRYERQEGLMENVAERYRELWELMSRLHMSSWHMVDGTGSIADVEARILSVLKTSET